MKTIIRFSSLLLIIISLNACFDNDQIPEPQFNIGAFILNEGAFGSGNASVSFYSLGGDSIMNDLYMQSNNRPLGDVLQSSYLLSQQMYLVLNGSDKVVIVQTTDFTQTGVIEGLNSPRYMTSINGQGFITQWGDGGVVKIVNLDTRSVNGTIEVGNGPEDIMAYDGRIWVANSGGLSKDSTVTVINSVTTDIEDTLVVGHSPRQFQVDANGDIWVLCSGHIEYDENWNIVNETPSKLVRIAPSTQKVVDEITLFNSQHPGQLHIGPNRQNLYVGGGFGFEGIYRVNITATAAPSSPLIEQKFFYGFGINPANGEIYALEAPDFTSNGVFCRYESNGDLINQYEVGIGPRAIQF